MLNRRAGFLAVLMLSTQPAAAQMSDVSRRVAQASGFVVVGRQAEALRQLPAPASIAAADSTGSCINTELKFADDTARNEWAAPGYSSVLNFWAILHYGSRAGTSRGDRCQDFEFSARRWQQALGESATGALTTQQVRRFTQVVDAADPSFAAARGRQRAEAQPASPPRASASAAGDRSLSSAPEVQAVATPVELDREPLMLDVLPRGPRVTNEECLAGAQEAMNWVRQMTSRGLMRYRADAWRTDVPEHWSRFTQRNDEVGIWTQQYAPRDCAARTRLRGWLRAIGDPSANIDDPASVASSERYVRDARARLAQAQAEFARLSAEREQQFRQAADQQSQARGDAARAMRADLAALSLGNRRADVAARLPSALCRIEDGAMQCAAASDQCTRERDSIAAAERRATMARLRGVSPAEFGDIVAAFRKAQTALRQCEYTASLTAASRSSLAYGEHSVRSATLRFERDALIEVSFSVEREVEAVRSSFTRRYGAPTRLEEQRVVAAMEKVEQPRVVLPTDIRAPWDPPVGSTIWEEQIVPTVDTIAIVRFIWTSSGSVIENSGSTFIIRLAGR